MAVVYRPALADAYANSIVNSTGWRICVWTDPLDGQQYCVVYDGLGITKMLVRQPGSQTFVVATGPFSGALSDPHYALSMGLDRDNSELIVFGPVHNDPNKQARRPLNNLDFADWEVPPVDADEQGVTYQQTLNATNGQLLRGYRDGSSGSGNQILKYNDPVTRTWQVIHSPWVQGLGYNPNLSPYFNGGLIECLRGRLHSSWCWRETTGWTNSDWMYMSSGDYGVNWENMLRQAITVPVTRPTAESQFVRAWIIDRDLDGLMNTQTMAINEWTGQPIIGGWWDSNRNGKSQFNVVSYGVIDGVSTWFRRQSGVEVGNFTLVGNPQGLPRMLSQPLLVWYDGVTCVFYRSDQRTIDTGPGLYANFCRVPLEDATLEDWETVRVTDQPLGDNGTILASVMDSGHWKRRGRVVQKLQILYQEESGNTPPIGDRDVSIAEIDLPAPTGVVTWTNYALSVVLNALRGIASLPSIATWRVRLFLGNTELSGNGYAPLELASNAANWPPSNGRIKWLAGVHEFPAVAGAPWVFDRVYLDDGANIWCMQVFATPITAAVGKVVRFGTGAAALTLSFDGGPGGFADAPVQAVLDDLFGAYAPFVTEATTFGAYFQGDPRDEFSVQLTAAPLAIPNDNTRWDAALAGVTNNIVPLAIAYEVGATHWAELTSTDELFCCGPLPASFGTPPAIPENKLPLRLF